MSNMNERYLRQITLPGWGISGQERLSQARILVIGAGGLGCPALQYLAAAGVGRITIVDFDKVSLSNLNRQVLFTPADTGHFKAETAKSKLELFNPGIQIEAHNTLFNKALADELVPAHDLVLDCTDRPDSRYLINDACVQHGKPFIYAGIHRFEGQLAVFNFRNSATYRCVFPEEEQHVHQNSCEENGVAGTAPGILGIMQANEAIKLFIAPDEVMTNELLIINLKNNNQIRLKLTRNEAAVSSIHEKKRPQEISSAELVLRMNSGEIFSFIDVRELHERPHHELLKDQQMPMSSWNPDDAEDVISKAQTTIIYCQHGFRSLVAISTLPAGLQHRLLSLRGGMVAFIEEITRQHDNLNINDL